MEKRDCSKQVKYFLLGILVLIILVVISPWVLGVSRADDLCSPKQLSYCSCDRNCPSDQICITKSTEDNVKLTCSLSADRINIARQNGRDGFCASVWSRTVAPDGTVFDNYETEGTLFCPVMIIETVINFTTNNTLVDNEIPLIVEASAAVCSKDSPLFVISSAIFFLTAVLATILCLRERKRKRFFIRKLADERTWNGHKRIRRQL